MQPLDPDGGAVTAREFDRDLALAHDRRLVLADLIALRQIRIEVVLAVEPRAQIDLRIEAETAAHRLADALLVDHGQHAWHRRVDQRDMRVRLAAKLRRGAGKQFRLRGDLGVNLQPDHHFPVAGGTLDQIVAHARSPPSSADAIRSHSVSRESLATGWPACRYQ